MLFTKVLPILKLSKWLLTMNVDNNIAVPRVDNEKMRNVLKVFSEDLTIMRAPLSKKALKFVEAARYGQTRKNVAKCEHRYQCSLPMEIIQQVF